MKFNKTQLDYLKKLSKQVTSFLKRNPGHKLATLDLEALEEVIEKGKVSDHLVNMLSENIKQIESNPIWKMNSQNQIELMQSVLAVIGQDKNENKI